MGFSNTPENRVHSLTEGGVLAAVTVVMALVGVYVPILGMIAILLWPLPVIVLIVRHGLRWGVMAVVVASLLTAAIVEPSTALRLAIAFGPVGLALGLGYRRGWSGVKLFTVSMVVSMIAKVAGLLLVFFLTGIEPFSGQFAMMDESFAQAADMYRSMGMSEEQIAASEQNFVQNMNLVKLLVPLIVVMMGLMDTMINYIVGGKILTRLGETVPTFPPFMEWRMPSAFLYAFCLSLIGVYFGSTRDIPLLYKASYNVIMACTLVGLVQGISLYQYIMNYYRWSKIVRGILLVLIFMNGILLQIFSFVGLLDTVFDYRKRYFSGKK